MTNVIEVEYCGFEDANEPGRVCHRAPGHEGDHSEWPDRRQAIERSALGRLSEPLVLRGDARHLASLLPVKSAACVVTSPPYWGLRVYGDDPAELGATSLDDYLADIKRVGMAVSKVLRDDGVFWLNIGDTASGSGGAGGDYNRGGRKEGKPRYRQGKTAIPAMSWCLVPQRVAVAMSKQGWLVRSVITWDKGRIRPESLDHVRRPGVSHETILMLVKQPSYRFFPEGLVESGDVWHFPPAKGGHLAPFPEELPRRAILASTEPGDLVVDPFSGSGTTLRVAHALGRRAVGVELYGEA